MYVTGVIDGLARSPSGLTASECAVLSRLSQETSFCFDAVVGALLNLGVVLGVELVLRELDELDFVELDGDVLAPIDLISSLTNETKRGSEECLTAIWKSARHKCLNGVRHDFSLPICNS